MRIVFQVTEHRDLSRDQVEDVFHWHLRDLAHEHRVTDSGVIEHVYDTHPHKGDDMTRDVGHIISPLRVSILPPGSLDILQESLDLRIKVLAHLLEVALRERKNRATNSRS
jgi:hypothetical protein